MQSAAKISNPPLVNAAVSGPILPFTSEAFAAVQLHQTGRSFIAQHFHRMDEVCADFSTIRPAANIRIHFGASQQNLRQPCRKPVLPFEALFFQCHLTLDRRGDPARSWGIDTVIGAAGLDAFLGACATDRVPDASIPAFGNVGGGCDDDRLVAVNVFHQAVSVATWDAADDDKATIACPSLRRNV